MIHSFKIRLITEADHPLLREVYVDAIESQCGDFYTTEQIQAWTSLAWLPGILDRVLFEGKGWLVSSRGEIEAFALRQPLNRLALLYSRGRSARRGFATALLNKIEIEALKEGHPCLITEASMCSQPLFLKCGWTVQSIETIKIGGVSFERYRMKKKLF